MIFFGAGEVMNRTILIRRLGLCSIAAIGLAAIGLAIPRNGDGASLLVFGAGALPCEAWLEHAQSEDPDHVVMASWMDGYLTAANEGRPADALKASLGKDTEGAARDAWVAQYCRAHPEESLYRATGALVAYLHER